MNRNSTARLPLPVILVALMASGCNLSDVNDNGISDLQSIQKIAYSFGDSSVPPEYHRSYTIIVTASTATVVIDSYGDVLADEEYAITDAAFLNLRGLLETYSIRNCGLGSTIGCAGGTSESISCSDADSEVFAGTVYHCGGADSGSLCGNVTSFAEAARSTVPDFEVLLQSTEEP